MRFFRKEILIFFVTLLSGIDVFCVVAKAETEEKISVPIIMYHQVKQFKSGKDSITPNEFECDLIYLEKNGYTTINMTDLIDYVYTGRELPSKPIILSFDDGYYNNYVYVYPLLKKYNQKIVISLIGKSTDAFSAVSDINIDYSHITWDQVNEMLASGFVEIQNHTYNLHRFTRKRIGCSKKTGESLEEYEKLLSDDITKFQEEIKIKTGMLPNTFNYPFGEYCDESEKIIKKLGFKASLTCDYGINVLSKEPDCLFGLKRICRSHNVSLEKLLKKLCR